MADTASDTPPDRLSLDPRSDYFDESLLSRGVGIKFNGHEKTNVIEYSHLGRLDPRRRRAQPRPLRPADDAQASGQGRALFRRARLSPRAKKASRPKDRTAAAPPVAPFPERPSAQR